MPSLHFHEIDYSFIIFFKLVKSQNYPGMFINKFLLLYLFSLLLFYEGIKAQPAGLRFKHYTTVEGLSQGDIYHLNQDSRGFIWFCTFDGLDRFDGYSFKNFKPDPNNSHSIEGGRINAIVEEKNGMLWVGTNEALNRYDFKSESFEHYYVRDSSNNRLKVSYDPFFIDDKNELWFTYKNNLGSMSLTTGKITTYPFTDGKMGLCRSAGYPAKKLYRHLSKIYSVGNDGIRIIDMLNKQIQFYFSSNKNNLFGKQTLINQVLEDKDHILWLGTINGLTSFDPATKKMQLYNKYQTKKIAGTFSLTQDKDDNIWCSSLSGLCLFNVTTRKFIRNYYKNPTDPESLGENYISSLFIDKDNNIWVGIDPDGIDKINPYYEQLSHVKINPEKANADNSSSVWSIAEIDTNKLLICSNHKDLLVYNRITGERKKIDLPAVFKKSFNNNFAILDSRKRIWLASDSGLCRSDNKMRMFDLIEKKDFSDAYLFEYRERIFIGANNGLFSLPINKQTHHVEPIHLFDGKKISFIGKSPNGHLCVATFDKELFLIDMDSNGKVTVVKKIVFDFQIKSIVFYDENTLWLGTCTGLVRYTISQKTLKTFTEKEGLANNYVYCLLKGNDGDLWMSTNHGISKFDPATERFSNYGLAEGAQALEFNTHSFFQSSSGTIYFGGVKGFNYFNPLKIKKNNFEPPVEILKISVDGYPVSLDRFLRQSRPVKFPGNETNISVEFAALDFNRNDNINYLYRLHSNEDWISIGKQRTLSFVNLIAGDYYLEVKAQYSNSETSPHVLKFAFTVPPAFYRTYWFITIVFVVVLLIIYGVYKFRISQLMKMLSIHNNIARDLHDDIGNTLGSINMYIEVATSKLKTQKPVEAEGVLIKMGDASRDMVERMSDIVWSINPGNDSFENLYNRMHDFTATMLAPLEIEFTFNIYGDLNKTAFTMKQRKNIFLIFKEAIYNITKYARSKQVTILLKKEGDRFQMTIHDDGKGFDMQTITAYNGNGIKNMQARALEIGGKLDIISGVNAGTAVELIALI